MKFILAVCVGGLASLACFVSSVVHAGDGVVMGLSADASASAREWEATPLAPPVEEQKVATLIREERVAVAPVIEHPSLWGRPPSEPVIRYGHEISGRILNPLGHPVPELGLQLDLVMPDGRSRRAPGAEWRHVATTDGEGYFSFPELRRDHYRLRLALDESIVLVSSVTTDSKGLALTLRPARLFVKPWESRNGYGADPRIECYPCTAHGVRASEEAIQSWELDAEFGFFVEPGQWYLLIAREGYEFSERAVFVPLSDTEMRVAFDPPERPGGRVQVHVADGAGVAPCSNVQLEVFSQSGFPVLTDKLPAGETDIALHLSPGRYRLRMNDRLEQYIDIPRDGKTRAEFTEQVGARLRIFTHLRGENYMGCSPRAQLLPTDGGLSIPLTFQTEDGRVSHALALEQRSLVREEFVPGNYILQVTAAGYRDFEQKLRLRCGEPNSVRISLRPE